MRLQCNRLNLVYSCQCVWIICLITLYEPSKCIDISILGLPFFISNRIKSVLIKYAKKSDQSLSYLLKSIIASYLFIVVGQYLMIVSTEPQRIIEIVDIWVSYKKLRLTIAFFAWMITSLAVQTVYTLNQQIEAIIIKGQLDYEIAQISKISLTAKINAYLLCAIAMVKVDTYRNLYSVFSQICYVCILLCFSGAALMYNNNNFKVLYKQTDHLLRSQESFSIKEQHIRQSYFSGYIKLWSAPLKLKIYSIALCCTNVIKFTVRLYCTMWIVQSFLGDHQMIYYKRGIQIGSIMLCLFTIPNYSIREYIRTKWKVWEEQRIKRILYEVIFIAITILTILSCYFSIKIQNPLLIILSVFLCSILIGNLQIFLQNDEEFIGVNVPQFQMCQNCVFKIANYITLFGIPISLHLLEEKVRKINAIYFIIGSSIILLILKFYILVKVHKKKIKQQLEDKSSMIDGKWQLIEKAMRSSTVISSKSLSGNYSDMGISIRKMYNIQNKKEKDRDRDKDREKDKDRQSRYDKAMIKMDFS